MHEAGEDRGRKEMWPLPLKGPSSGPGPVDMVQGTQVWRDQRDWGGWRPCPHRAVLPLGLDAARVVVLDAAARVPLQLTLPQHQLLDLLVLPDAGRELGPQVDQVDLVGVGWGGLGRESTRAQPWPPVRRAMGQAHPLPAQLEGTGPRNLPAEMLFPTGPSPSWGQSRSSLAACTSRSRIHLCS